jgi:hypothetical protein
LGDIPFLYLQIVVYQDLSLRDRSGKHGVLFTDKDIALPDINGRHGVPLPDKEWSTKTVT